MGGPTAAAHRLEAIVLALVTLASGALASCGGGASSSGQNHSSKTGGTLTYGIRLQNGLNPTKAGGASIWFHPAYETLLYMAQDGSFKPDLATSFGWV